MLTVEGVWGGMRGGVAGGSVRAMAATTGGASLYVGGDFTTAGGMPAVGVARWDGDAWHGLGSVEGGTVQALATAGEELYLGGDFTSAGGVSCKGLVRFQAGAFRAISGGVDGAVTSLVFTRECLYVGGSFSSVFGEFGTPNAASKAARWCGEELEGLQGAQDINHVWAVASAAADWGSTA